MSTLRPAIIPAWPTDASAVASLISTAFVDLDLTRWLVPQHKHRYLVLRRTFALYADHALHHGQVWITAGMTGAAVWLPRACGETTDPSGLITTAPDIADYDRQLTNACGRYVGRFRQLDAAFDTAHPTTRAHYHLAFLAADPIKQGRGIGSALLDHSHRLLDNADVPAYLEAVSPTSRALYLRHGYTDHGPPIQLPHGPTLWPMWREPNTQHRGLPKRSQASRPVRTDR